MNDGQTHFEGDTCPGGHRRFIEMTPEGIGLDPLVENLRALADRNELVQSEDRDLVREAADRLERMEAVVEAARGVRGCENFYEPTTCENFREENDPPLCPQCGVRRALAALDVIPSTKPARSCPNAVSFCAGPDRYEGICNACLTVWTEEAKEKK